MSANSESKFWRAASFLKIGVENRSLMRTESIAFGCTWTGVGGESWLIPDSRSTSTGNNSVPTPRPGSHLHSIFYRNVRRKYNYCNFRKLKETNVNQTAFKGPRRAVGLSYRKSLSQARVSGIKSSHSQKGPYSLLMRVLFEHPNPGNGRLRLSRLKFFNWPSCTYWLDSGTKKFAR